MMECDNGYDFIINFCKTIIEGEVDLTKAEYRILIYLIVALDDKKFKQITQVKISRLLNIHKSAVSRGIRHLVTLGILEQSDDHYNEGYRLTLNFKRIDMNL